MTRTTNARIAGFTYLFYAAIGMCLELLMHQARGVGSDAAKLARIGQYAMNVRLSILIALLEGLSSLNGVATRRRDEPYTARCVSRTPSLISISTINEVG